MEPYNLLAALPALLGLSGFVLYQAVGANRAGDDISRLIVDKLRRYSPNIVPPDQRLTARQVSRLLEQQQFLRAVVDDREYALLEQSLRQQFHLNIFVYALTVGFCVWSAYLFARPATGPKQTDCFPNQASSGARSPNIASCSSGPVTVTIQNSQSRTSITPQEQPRTTK